MKPIYLDRMQVDTVTEVFMSLGDRKRVEAALVAAGFKQGSLFDRADKDFMVGLKEVKGIEGVEDGTRLYYATAIAEGIPRKAQVYAKIVETLGKDNIRWIKMLKNDWVDETIHSERGLTIGGNNHTLTGVLAEIREAFDESGKEMSKTLHDVVLILEMELGAE